ncbi:MAG TPA: hypothetical protein VLG92_05880 [Candidatus Saccharimonadia bacterium]|nr:hypothetical protein [Candidatus Saccharimonadia bacterium]
MSERSLPFNFDPVEQLIDPEDNRHLANIPLSGDFLLRWYPHGQVWHGYLLNEEAEARRCIEQTNAHHKMLQLLGITIPQHHDFIGIRPESNEREIAIYSLVERVNYAPLTDAKRAKVGASLQTYLDWVIQSRQEGILDLFAAEQFGTIPPAPDTGSEVVLLDIDPRFVSNYSYFQDRARDLIADFLDS